MSRDIVGATLSKPKFTTPNACKLRTRPSLNLTCDTVLDSQDGDAEMTCDCEAVGLNMISFWRVVVRSCTKKRSTEEEFTFKDV